MTDLNEKTFFETVNKQKETCVILFSKATCPICQQVTPILQQLEAQYAAQSVQFYHVDAVAEKDLLERVALKGVPQVMFFQNGDLCGKYAGIREEAAYRAKIEEILQ